MSGMSRDWELDWSLVRKSAGPTLSTLIFTPVCCVYFCASCPSAAACPRDWFMNTISELLPVLPPPDPQAASVVTASPPPTAPRKPRRDRNVAAVGETASALWSRLIASPPPWVGDDGVGAPGVRRKAVREGPAATRRRRFAVFEN